MLWQLVRLTRYAESPPKEAEACNLLQAKLTALCDDYEQHLFEEECLLLPRIAGRQSHVAAAKASDREQGATSAVAIAHRNGRAFDSR
jgi:iron-sulfur cluster repair protein YtfE (RIC family)